MLQSQWTLKTKLSRLKKDCPNFIDAFVADCVFAKRPVGAELFRQRRFRKSAHQLRAIARAATGERVLFPAVN